MTEMLVLKTKKLLCRMTQALDYFRILNPDSEKNL